MKCSRTSLASAWCGLVALLLALLASAAFAGGRINFQSHLDSLRVAAWVAVGVDFTVEIDGLGPARLNLVIERLEPPWPAAPLTEVVLECVDFSYSSGTAACANGNVRVASRQGNEVLGAVAFVYRPGGESTLEITDLALAGGRVAVQGRGTESEWNLDVSAIDVDAAAFVSYLRESSEAASMRPRGRIRIDAGLSGYGEELRTARWEVAGKGVGFSAVEGRYAAEGLNLNVSGHWESRDGRFITDIALSKGQLYLEPLYWEIAAYERVAANVAGRLSSPRLHVERLTLRDAGRLAADASATILLAHEPKLERLKVAVTEAEFPAAYQRYLQPFLVDTMLGNLQTGGSVTGRLEASFDAIQTLELDLNNVRLEDEVRRFGIRGMEGRLVWGRDQADRNSRLRWDQGHVYRLPLGPADVEVRSRGGAFSLARETRIPILDGAVVIERLDGSGLGSDDLRWTFDGLVTPVSMEMLSSLLEWPLLSGKLSGVIPRVSYSNHRLDVGGALLVRIFDGDVAITRLRIEDPFGVVPRVRAEVDIRELDLSAVTRTFDVGKIEGKISGWISGLQLDAWQPTAFDARIATPLGDDSRHRISQRAVENLSTLGGGGASAALSKGFLSMFKEFRYKRLGIRCQLRNGVCDMGGVGPAGDGYYLVEGEGLPRIDVIGHTRQVDWDELLARLNAALKSDGPVIE